jgi:hypothetical protein
MKKLLITLCIAALSSAAFAQTIDFGIKAGLNLSNQTLSGAGQSMYSKNLTGFNVGGIMDLGLGDFSIQPGIFFTTKGYESNPIPLYSGTGQNGGTDKIKLDYIQVPVNLLYHIHIVPGLKFYLGGGPYLGYGVSGKVTGGGESADIHFSKITDGFSYKNPDFGVNFIAGFEIEKRILLDASYGLGLSNITYSPTATMHNRVRGISVGYLF